LWDPPQAIEAFRLASQVAHEAGRKVALSLSDAFCVDRHRDDFLDMINLRRVDLVFANEHELKSLYQTGDLETALSAAAQAPAVFAVTRSADGCAVLDGGEREDIPAFHVDEVVDVTGAGDLFASGFLYGLSCGGLSLSDCGRLGCLAASEAITHFGARPQASLRTLARDRGLLS
jgi:sugar/nucleoside kinase (ribokinase family)